MITLQTTPDSTQPSDAISVSKNANIQSIGLIVGSVAFGAIGQLILKAGMKSLGPLQLSVATLVSMATSPLLLVGIAIFGISTLLWLLALMKADLSFAYPFLSLTYIAVLIGGAVLFQENVTLPRMIGFAIIVAGVLIVARSEQKKG